MACICVTVTSFIRYLQLCRKLYCKRRWRPMPFHAALTKIKLSKNPADFLLPARRAEAHGCRSWWFLHPCDRGVLERCEYRNRFVVDVWQRNDGTREG